MVVDVAIAQFRPVKADPAASLAEVERIMARAAGLDPRPRLLLFPEAALTGYFLEGGVREHALPASRLFEELRACWARAADPDLPLDVAIGFFELAERRVYNSALYARVGGTDPAMLHVHRKVFLPTYGVFQEERFVEPGAGIAAFDTGWGRAALLICEDAFHSISGTLAALDGAELVLIPSASPARGAQPGPGLPGNLARWEGLASAIGREHGVFVAVSQLVGFEGGKGFPGGSAVFGPDGARLMRGPLWREALLPVRLEPGELLTARVEEPLLADLERSWTRLLVHSPGAGVLGPSAPHEEARPAEAASEPELPPSAADPAAPPQPTASPQPVSSPQPEGSPQPDVTGRSGASGDGRHDALVAGEPVTPGTRARPLPEPDAEVGRSDARPPEDEPDVELPRDFFWPRPDDVGPLEIDTELVEEWLVEFLREEIVRRRGFRHVVVGLSGGVDSSLTAALCVRALGAESATGLLLPYRTSSAESGEHARVLAEQLGIRTRTIDITEAVDGYLAAHEPEAGAHRAGNVAARQRMIVLFDQAAKLDALPVGTGNKSERLLGYFTWHADDTPPINPLGDLFKVQVWALARAVGIPAEIVDKPASADLIKGQTDEEDLGITYPEADLILHWLLTGQSPERLAAHGFDPEKIRLVRERLEGTHWKRHLPTVAMLSATTIGEWYLRPVDY